MTTRVAIQTELRNDSDVAGVVGSDVWPIRRPQGAGLPCVLIRGISEPRTRTMSNASTLVRPRWQVKSQATTVEVADELAGYVYAALDGFSGTLGGVGGVVVQWIEVENQIDQHYQLEGSEIWEIVQDVRIAYRRP